MAEKKVNIVNNYGDGGGAVYGLGVVGALFYFLQQAQNATDVLWGILMAILWPAFVVYKLLSFLQL